MKKILITGANSYVGKSLQNWLGTYPERYLIDTISLRKDSWKELDFSNYDVVFHVAGIAHIKETKENTNLYYRVNRDLAYETAKKAKNEGVKQFIYLSSMSVYGIESGIINKNSPLKPRSNYGKSKLEGEKLINELSDNKFKLSIIRPPMIYGRGCKGNYTRLAMLAIRVPFFPNIENQRSMIYIENLCEFIRLLIENSNCGLYFPQNKEYVKTSEMARLIAKAHGKNLRVTKLLNLFLFRKFKIINKVFGSLVYEKKMSEYHSDYQVCNFAKTIEKTETEIYEGKIQ
jgi:nucleoside-diphosphate-sugar epimerase